MLGDQCKLDHGSDAVVLEDNNGSVPYQPVALSGGGAYAGMEFTAIVV